MNRLTLLVVFFLPFFVSTIGTFYTIEPGQILEGWSYELKDISRVSCLQVCSKKTYCWSVNYSPKDRVCRISRRIPQDASATVKIVQTPAFLYIEKVLDSDFKRHGILFDSTKVTYEEASVLCEDKLGSLATYEQLYDAFADGTQCAKGWLISREVAFTEISDACTMKPSVERSNVFVCGQYRFGFYCFRERNIVSSTPTADYIPKSQRLIRISESLTTKLYPEEADQCCRDDYSGRMSTSFEAYNATYSMNVNFCGHGCYSGRLCGDICKTDNSPSKYWDPETLSFMFLSESYYKQFSFCYIPLHGEGPISAPNPYPPHRVVVALGTAGAWSYTYDIAIAKCKDYGGRLATRAEVQYAYNMGLESIRGGWIEEGDKVYVLQRSRSWESRTGIITFEDYRAESSAYCYIP
ncbi:uncharacterized protein [Antedon mediterranea]|uniref:uncharacterized protein n=1 Tax=Antedon mediterranea TaxID=105859 RepID=UPI003AF4316E